MVGKDCCNCGSESAPREVFKTLSDAAQQPSLARRMAATVKWAIPGTVLVLVPKCPMCLAMWIAIYSGIGMTVATASRLRTTIISICAVVLFLQVIQVIGRHFPKIGK